MSSKLFDVQDVDVVILNFRVGQLAAEAARSAFTNGARSIVVVDNYSGDDSLKILEREVSHFATIVCMSSNSGFSAGNNAGASAGNKPLVLFMNPDVTLMPGALLQMVDVVNSNPGVDMVGPALQGPDREPQASAYHSLTPASICKSLLGLDKLASLIGYAPLSGNSDIKRNGNYSGPVESLYGACLMVRRSAFEAICGFDEDFFLYCEETDLCLRLKRAGGIAYRCGKACAVHWHGQSARQVARLSLMLMSESHRIYARKHFSRAGRVVTALGFVAGLLLRTLIARDWKAKRSYFAALGLWCGWSTPVDPRKRIRLKPDTGVKGHTQVRGSGAR